MLVFASFRDIPKKASTLAHTSTSQVKAATRNLLFPDAGWASIKTAMAFKDFSKQQQCVTLLQRSLERGRLGHAYLFAGARAEELEALAKALAKTLNCQQPKKSGDTAIDSCDECVNCRKIDQENHADVFWVRPESISRQIKIEFITHRKESSPRVLLDAVHKKPTESRFKIAIVSGADRMTPAAANAFLKTLEEPPPNSVLILLSTEPRRMLETILSRCLRLNFGGEGRGSLAAAELEWLQQFSRAAVDQKSLLGRYRLMDVLLQKLAETKMRVEEALSARSPLERYDEVEEELRKKWEQELKAAIEAEYRRLRGDFLVLIQGWLRDVWLRTLAAGMELANFPDLAGTEQVARRITSRQAMENLMVMEQTQRLLHTNVQEGLAIELGFLKLHL